MAKRNVSVVVICTLLLTISSNVGCFETDEEDGDETHLVAYYKFNEGNGIVLIDNSNHGNDGSIHGANWIEGIDGTALHFDGIDDYVEVPDSSSLDIKKSITIEAWLRPQSVMNNGEGVVFKSNNLGTSPIYGMFLHFNGMARLQIFTDDVGVFSPNPTPVLPLNNWSHVAGTYDGTTMINYLNGEAQPSIEIHGAGNLETNDEDVYIGFSSGNFQEYFNGTIDEIRIYSRALSGDEINTHYEEFMEP